MNKIYFFCAAERKTGIQSREPQSFWIAALLLPDSALLSAVSLCKFPVSGNYLFIASCTATATATVMPTIGLLPAPMRPIMSTCAGTEEEPAN